MILEPQDCGCPIVDEGPNLVDSSLGNSAYLFMVLLQKYILGRCDISTPCQRIQSVNETNDFYDFIVVGGGTSGSIVAGLLSEYNYTTLLLEAGGNDPVYSRVPSMYRKYWGNGKVDWNVNSVPGNYCLDQEGKGCKWPLAKCLGGNSVLNGMMYHQGHKADYDNWVAAGAEGWSWDEIETYIKMAEGNQQIGTVVDAAYHTDTGRMPIQHFPYQPRLLGDLLKAIKEEELPVISDMNNPNTPDGFCIAQTFNKDGQRYTTARVYLEPNLDRPTLSVKLNAFVTRVLFADTKAVGVEYVDAEGNTRTVKASKEVILSAGALHSPKILMLSGVGPRDTLDKLNMSLVADLPVGKNLKNHCGATLHFILTKLNNTQTLDWNALTDYLLERKGPMSATGLTQLTGLLYSSFANKTLNQPDLQFFFNGLYAEYSKTGVIGEPVGDSPENGYNISVNAVALLPRSVGYMTINSTNPYDQALYYPNFFSQSEDIAMIKEGLKIVKKIMDNPTLQNKYKVELDPEHMNLCSDGNEPWSDPWLNCVIRYHTDPQNHQLGTAAIGRVVDPELKVYGLTNLRVCDASAMPTQPTGNPQGAIMVVAHKCAHLIQQAWQ